MENNNQQSFWQFSDQLRVQQTSNLANLSLNDSIWSNSSGNMNNNFMPTKSERRNFDIRVGGDINSKEPASDFNDGWKQMMNSTPNGSLYNYNPLIGGGGAGLNGGFNKGIYDSKPMYAIANNNNLNNINLKGNNKVGGEDEFLFSHPHKISRRTPTLTRSKGKATTTTTTMIATTRARMPRSLKPCQHQSLCLGMKQLEATSLFATMIPWQRTSKGNYLVFLQGTGIQFGPLLQGCPYFFTTIPLTNSMES
uniref:Uncharacterized protein n=1 Tax=Lotus japonicus TaxID=34305 RepID=I3S007_LOTJA|nr:unknown [Lotus japonicus]